MSGSLHIITMPSVPCGGEAMKSMDKIST
ncbi:TPA: holin, partial [Escherichia coli]|nr:holin [Escherichia coli]